MKCVLSFAASRRFAFFDEMRYMLIDMARL